QPAISFAQGLIHLVPSLRRARNNAGGGRRLSAVLCLVQARPLQNLLFRQGGQAGPEVAALVGLEPHSEPPAAVANRLACDAEALCNLRDTKSLAAESEDLPLALDVRPFAAARSAHAFRTFGV